ncbi:MAG TPA: hypothetical protein PK264_01805 [Hyphomicrobiaceae bacterium]|nr:hypothetical protein [Hyphomicrobiaceae bacterium]
MPRFQRNTDDLGVTEEHYRMFRSLVPDIIGDMDQKRAAAIEAAKIYERALKRGSRAAAEQAARDWLAELQEQVGAQHGMGR